MLADLGDEGENTRLKCPIKNTQGVALSAEQRTINARRSATRALAERGNSLLKITFKVAAPSHSVPVADRHHHRRRTRSVAPRARPDDLINSGCAG